MADDTLMTVNAYGQHRQWLAGNPRPYSHMSPWVAHMHYTSQEADEEQEDSWVGGGSGMGGLWVGEFGLG
jgi:hypothetical protein